MQKSLIYCRVSTEEQAEKGYSLDAQEKFCCNFAEHILQVSGDGQFRYRIADFAVLDPEARGAATIIAGNAVDTKADQAGYIKPGFNILDQLIMAEFARFHIQVCG